MDKNNLTNVFSIKETLELMRAKHNSVAHWESQVKTYEQFRDSDPLNGQRRWNQHISDSRKELQRVIALVTNGNGNGNPDGNPDVT